MWKSQLLGGRIEIATAQAVAVDLAAIHDAKVPRENMALAFKSGATFHNT